jgi:hypothetical protein
VRRVWWLALFAFFLLPAAWAIATPYNGAYDEHHHVVRAAGVVRGQILVPPVREYYDGGYQTVPRSLVPANHDCLGDGRNPASCLGAPSSDRSPVRVQTGAARYNPAYYAVVGWPLAALPTMTGIILTRLISALLCAAFLASALVTIWPLRRYRLLPLAFICSVTPVLVCLNGLVNPSGLEIVAAIGLWAALVRLLPTAGRDPSGALDPEGPEGFRRVVVRAVVAGAVVAFGRPPGIGVVVAVVAVAVFALASRAALRGLLRRRDVRIGIGVVALTAALAVAWMLVSRIADFGHDAKIVTDPTPTVIRYIVLNLFDYWTRGTVALFGYGNIGVPAWVIVAWATMQGALVLLGFGYAKGRRHAYTIVGIPVAAFLLGFAVEMMMIRKVGYFMQGRYMLPLLVGAFFLAALAVPPTLLGRRGLRRIYLAAFGIWAGTLVFSMYVILRHYRYGGGAALPKNWQPEFGPLAPYAVLLAGIALTGLVLWRVGRRTSVLEPPDEAGQRAV